MEPFLGQLMLVSFNFAPKGWAMCNGQFFPINQNQALFSLLGTTYGGDGITTFQLPNLQARAAMSSGQGPGLPVYNLGQVSGEENVTLLSSQMPQHNHLVSATKSIQTAANPTGNAFAEVTNQANFDVYKANGVPASVLHPASVSLAGGSQPHANQSPFLVLNWIIALQGIFPSQN